MKVNSSTKISGQICLKIIILVNVIINSIYEMSVECFFEENTTVSNQYSEAVQVTDDFELRFNEITPMRNRCSAAEEELDRCSAQLLAFGQSHVQYPHNMDELNAIYCPNFKKNIDCVKNSTECFRPFEKQIINWILTSTRRINHKRCKNDSEKQRFLKLTKSCFSPMKHPMDRCMSKYIASLEAIAESDGFVERSLEDDFQIQLSCCANMKFKRCVMNEAKQQCKPIDSIRKLKRTNSNTSQRIAHRSVEKAMSDMMEDLSKTLDAMALTGPEFICQNIDEEYCKSKFEGRFVGQTPRHRSIIPAMIKIYSNSQ